MVKDQQENQPRIRSDRDLLQVAIQHHDPSAMSDSGAQFQQMSEERRQFLESAIKDITVDYVEVLKKQIEKLNELIAKLRSRASFSDEEVKEYSKLLEDDLVENVSNMDFANDFYKLGGFNALTELIDSDLSTFKVPTMALVAELVQNNEFCQRASYDLNYLSKFTNIIETETNEMIVLKTIYALSCLIRGNDQMLNEFLQRDDNIRSLLSVMTNLSSNEKIVFKISFLLNSICGLRPELYSTLSRLNFISMAVKLMESDVQRTHEYILAILVGMCENSDEAKRNCKNEPQLKKIVEDKIKLFKNKDEYLEEVDYCSRLLEILS